MQLRVFGRAGIQLSVLGCGAVGGFMVRGDPVEQERTIAWAGTTRLRRPPHAHSSVAQSASTASHRNTRDDRDLPSIG
jgi:hypothetical protein